MAIQTVIEGPLRVVVRPGSEAAASYRSAVLAPGFEPEPGLDLQYFGGRAPPHPAHWLVYPGGGDVAQPAKLALLLAAAGKDAHPEHRPRPALPRAKVSTPV